jgi:hypothetical protein
MAGEGSAYAALGLEPGADAAAIERAYKQLIKRYHPDRQGGDAKRAAEINRAYRELRSAGANDALALNQPQAFDPAAATTGNSWVRAALVLAIAVATLLIVTGPMRAWVRGLSPTSAHSSPVGQVMPAARAGDPMDAPLAAVAVDRAVGDAVRLSRTKDEMALASESRDCHRLLRLNPSLTQLDRCAAFDDAVVELQDRDPLRDQGPFSELDVTGRQWSGASALSDDYLAIDSRLDRIRLRVELALAPAPVLPEAN